MLYIIIVAREDDFNDFKTHYYLLLFITHKISHLVSEISY